jgi:Zn-dependent protease with chaperone function
VKYLVLVLLIMHGLAHVTGVLGFLGQGQQAFGDQPWIFSQGITAHSAVGKAWALLWLVALIGLVGTGLGLLFRQGWWPAAAMAAAAVSLVAIVPWLKVVPPGAWGGALLDLAILVALLSPWADRLVEVLR